MQPPRPGPPGAHGCGRLCQPRAPRGGGRRRAARAAGRPAGHAGAGPEALADVLVRRLPRHAHQRLCRRLLPDRRLRRTQRRRQHQLYRPRRRRHHHFRLPGGSVRRGKRADRTPGGGRGRRDRQARPRAHRADQGLRGAGPAPPGLARTGRDPAPARAPAPGRPCLPARDRVRRRTAQDPQRQSPALYPAQPGSRPRARGGRRLSEARPAAALVAAGPAADRFL
ncbi:hypothetical protein CBM2634_B100149 [Cupriavidus taiwanensis]|uniref:Uncharacterized protein n=1 Tax=Cupriavidus taiwanensis TaxID=164546 RepID=A0A375J807_9BURK|nr:hypothetical protein CBM2634_B100149 [Cupriavidus taiwanensis]